MKKKCVILDLDGTLVNTSEGIFKSVQYALDDVGIFNEPEDNLRRFIGPPLEYSFKTFYGLDAETTEHLIAKYRERYVPIGLYESELYPGVREFVAGLKEKGYKLSLGSSKPEDMCIKLLDSFEILDMLDFCVGATVGPERRTKEKVLIEALDRMEIDASECVLIGDTRFDVEGARSVGMDCIGITYGFGTREDLEKAGAVAIFDTLNEVLEYL